MPFSDYPEINPTVTVEEVRTAFGGADASVIPDATIQLKIDEEMLIVAAHLPDDLDQLEVPESQWEAAVEMLIRRRVAEASWQATPTKVRKQALDASVSYDIQGFRAKLENNIDDAYDVLGIARDDGGSAAIADATGSAFRNRTNIHPDYN